MNTINFTVWFVITLFSTTLSNFQKCFLFKNAFSFLKKTIISQIFLYFEGMKFFLKSVVGRDTQVWTNSPALSYKTKADGISWCLHLSCKWAGHLSSEFHFHSDCKLTISQPTTNVSVICKVFEKYKAGKKPSQKSMLATSPMVQW